MAKKYTFLRVPIEVRNNLNMRVQNMNKDLAKMGAKKKLGQIDLISFLSSKLLYINDNELYKMAHRRNRKEC
jgi:hypothetical protein